MTLKQNVRSVLVSEAQSYHNLATWPLAADRHAHPLVLFAFLGCVLYAESGMNAHYEDLRAQIL